MKLFQLIYAIAFGLFVIGFSIVWAITNPRGALSIIIAALVAGGIFSLISVIMDSQTKDD